MSKTLGSDRQAALVKLLIREREASGMTQLQLAARLGEYQSFVARLESGQRRIDVIEFIELAQAIGFDPATALREILQGSV
ncbi:MAG TPA: helix-turn-helix transcriptional regulator [Rhabdaerophilum sp.]|nr:helix-turn-helix transcriptional regulator [Rhabdaerophilum sp.]